MASLDLKNGTYVVRFRHGSRSYKQSLKTRSRADAEAALSMVKLTLHRLMVGLLQLPPDVDPGDFVVSGGTATAARPGVPAPPLAAAVTEHCGQLGHLADTTRLTVRVQLNNLVALLKPVTHEPPGA
jgi:hypothetical protein